MSWFRLLKKQGDGFAWELNKTDLFRGDLIST